MRFKKIDTFNANELLLDEDNYRFTSAADQKDCVRKIFFGNESYFKGLLKSIAEDDLGEPLLVFLHGKEKIVLDGNRRLAAMKVLSDDAFLPAEKLKDFVHKLRENNTMDFSEIHAQVSDDKQIILKTVLERHSSAKTGTSRISWDAYAAARFKFFERVGDDKEWHFLAMLIETEKKHPDLTEFLENNRFWETYSRIMRAAFKKELISYSIFSEKDRRIKSRAPKNLVNDAVVKTYAFLQAMIDGELSLARGETFADKKTVDKFLDSFSLSPDAQQAADAKNAANQNDTQNDSSTSSSSSDHADENDTGDTKNEQASTGGKGETSDDVESNVEQNSKSGGYGVTKSDEIEKKLKQLKSAKLSRLYSSLCTISLNQHPELMYGGAWMFFEILSKAMGNVNDKTGKRKQEFTGFLNARMQSWKLQDEIRNECFSALKEIQEFGNSAKHSINKTRATALQLRYDFVTLEPLILAALDEAKSKKKKAA